MARNTERPNDGRKQIVYSAPRKLFKEKYLTKKGAALLQLGLISKQEAWEKYGKNRYVLNPDSHPVKEILHR